MTNDQYNTSLTKILEEYKYNIIHSTDTDSSEVSFRYGCYDIYFCVTYDNRALNVCYGDYRYPTDGDIEFTNTDISNLEICINREVLELTDKIYSGLTEVLRGVICE